MTTTEGLVDITSFDLSKNSEECIFRSVIKTGMLSLLATTADIIFRTMHEGVIIPFKITGFLFFTFRNKVEVWDIIINRYTTQQVQKLFNCYLTYNCSISLTQREFLKAS